jgi:hypothetical protein
MILVILFALSSCVHYTHINGSIDKVFRDDADGGDDQATWWPRRRRCGKCDRCVVRVQTEHSVPESKNLSFITLVSAVCRCKSNCSGNYNKRFFESSLGAIHSTLPFIALMRTSRPVFRPSLHSRYAATSSRINKPQTTNGKYLHATRVKKKYGGTRKSKQFTATRRCFLRQAQASAENCSRRPR